VVSGILATLLPAGLRRAKAAGQQGEIEASRGGRVPPVLHEWLAGGSLRRCTIAEVAGLGRDVNLSSPSESD
jgi:hypothetical protein